MPLYETSERKQRALDRAFMNSGFDMLERLEGRPRVDAQEAPRAWRRLTAR